MELKKLRDEIDNIDDQLAVLYKKRMEIARAVAEVKKENNTPIENSVREKEIINRVTSEMPDDIKLYAKEVFTTVFSTSKAYQSQMIDMTSKTVSLIKESLEKGLKSFPFRPQLLAREYQAPMHLLPQKDYLKYLILCI